MGNDTGWCSQCKVQDPGGCMYVCKVHKGTLQDAEIMET